MAKLSSETISTSNSNKYPKRDSIAIPLEESNFPNINTISDVFSEFIRYTNIRKEEIPNE